MTRLSRTPTRPVSKPAFLALALAIGLPACANTVSNPLIGTWKFVSTTNSQGPVACNSSFVFAENTATISTPPSSIIPGGAVRTMAVHYVPSPTLVSVVTDAAGHVNYNIVDKDHMYTEDAWGRYYYQRG